VPRCEDTGLGFSLVPEAGMECSVGVGSTAGLQQLEVKEPVPRTDLTVSKGPAKRASSGFTSFAFGCSDLDSKGSSVGFAPLVAFGPSGELVFYPLAACHPDMRR
jgi:hypothetical protein